MPQEVYSASFLLQTMEWLYSPFIRHPEFCLL